MLTIRGGPPAVGMNTTGYLQVLSHEPGTGWMNLAHVGFREGHWSPILSSAVSVSTTDLVLRELYF